MDTKKICESKINQVSSMIPSQQPKYETGIAFETPDFNMHPNFNLRLNFNMHPNISIHPQSLFHLHDIEILITYSFAKPPKNLICLSKADKYHLLNYCI